MKTIKAHHSHYLVSDYEIGDAPFLEKSLSVKDEWFNYKPKGFYYDEETKDLYVPRGVDPEFIRNQLRRDIDVIFQCDKYETTSFRLLVEPRDDYQRKGLSFLLGEGDYIYTKTRSQLALTLPTDSGKTYTAIASLYFLKMKAIIIVHQNRIKEQWKKSILTFTSLKEDDIGDITGTTVVNKIMKADKINEKIFLITHSEINAYAKKNGWNSITRLFLKLGVGVKIYDEAHLNFDNILKVDFFTNVKKTFYLTATFNRSEREENKLFNFCFSDIPKYGVEVKKSKRKHVVYVSVLFDSKPTLDDKAHCKGRKSSLDRNRYSDYLFSKDIIFDVILYAMHILRDNEGKIMILSSKISSVEQVYHFMKDAFPDKKVAMYHSKLSKEENEKINDADIISATPKAFGTGFDLKGLRSLIMLEPFSSTVNADQYSGRLREYGPDDNTFYVECVDKGFSSSEKMYKRRLKVFKQKCKKLLELTYRKE